MPEPLTPECKTLVRRGQHFPSLYGALTALSFHWSVVIYINSSYLERFFTSSDISILYIVGAIGTILLFLAAPRLLNRFGNFALMLFFAACECAALLGMALTGNAAAAALWFTLHSVVVSLLFFHADVFMETLIGPDEEATGAHRGFLLTIMSFVSALATLISGLLIGDEEPRFALAYGFSALTLLPAIILIVRNFRNFKDPEYPALTLIPTLAAFWKNPDIRNVFCSAVLLQILFVWLVVYTPLYMNEYMGLSWDLIGTMLFIGLLAYVFLEWPIGIAADRWFGEKEMMALGFLIIAVSTSWIAFLQPTDIAFWFVTMFLVRVGGSFVETTTESYFFKHTEGKDATLVSLYRITRPLSYIIAPIIGSVALLLLPFNLTFVVLALLMVPGLFFAMALNDTK